MNLHEHFIESAYNASESDYLDNLPVDLDYAGELEPPEPETFKRSCTCGREHWIETGRVELMEPADFGSWHYFDGRECKRFTAEEHRAATDRMWRAAYGRA